MQFSHFVYLQSAGTECVKVEYSNCKRVQQIIATPVLVILKESWSLIVNDPYYNESLDNNNIQGYGHIMVIIEMRKNIIIFDTVIIIKIIIILNRYEKYDNNNSI